MQEYRDKHVSRDKDLESQLTYLNTMGREVSGNAERRLKWLEVIKAINAAIPRTEYPDGKTPTPKELPYSERTDIHVTQADTKHYEDLAEWWTEEVQRRYREEMKSWAKVTGYKYVGSKDMTKEEKEAELEAQLQAETGPSGPGWVIELRCYHYYNDSNNRGEIESDHVRKVMTTNFLNKTVEPIQTVQLPTGKKNANGEDIMETFTLEEMGLQYPLLLDDNRAKPTSIPNPDYDPAALADMTTLGTGFDPENPPEGFEPPMLQVAKLDFTYQIVWKDNILSERLEAKEEARKLAEEQAAQEAAQQAAQQPAGDAAAAQ
jgi:type IV pilus assembly protein PilM